MKQLISRRSFLKAAGVTAAAASMAIGAPAASACWFGDKSDVTILYTNDVHTYIDKQSPKLTYAAIADLKQSYQNAGKDVLLVDAGDHVQGTAYGSMDEGASIIKLMNAAGYDVATPGNHEFDYGMDRAKAIMKEADFPYLSCNWVDLRTTLRVLPSVKVFVRGGRRIAFVGVTTPETFTKSTPAYFMDKAQRKYIYDIQGGEDGKKLYDAVQKAIDKAKLLADVVIGLGHLGVDPSSSPWTSEEVIAHTSGFDAFIDGHSHTVMENKQVQDASGKAVTLTQTGSYFANVGEMTIAADGTITTKLIPTHEGMDAGIAAMQTSWVNTVDDMLGEKIAVGDSDFYVSDPATGKRRIRSAETNLGDFVADGIYTYFNEVEKLHCDVAIMNGGGIRADVPAGDWTFKTCKQVSPFGNVACLMSVTGKQIQDALEFAARFAGEDGKENGGFLQVAGATYEIHTDIPNTVQTDEKNVWIGSATGTPRVQNVKIYDKASGSYLPLDPGATYALAGMNYTLRNLGDFVADGIYTYFNEVEQLHCDIAIMNGGGILADVNAGYWTFKTCKQVSPFGNVACLMSVTGKQIQDALEFAARFAGEGGKENGGFLQVAGAAYEIHTDIPNTVQTDEKNVWIGSATGTPRVQNVKIYDKASGSYLPLDPNKTYALAGMNYTLRNLGDGFAMFDGAELIKDYVSEDYLVMSTYAMAFGGVDAEGLPHLSSANSVLAEYPGYLLDYENPYGAGRISIL